MKKLDWFGPKRYGWGIGPRTWQGWLAVALYVSSVALIAGSSGVSQPAKTGLIAVATLFVVVLAIATYSTDR